MITGKLKYVAIALLFLIAILVGAVVYRLFFMFKKDKIKSYAEEQANNTGSPDVAFKLIMESCQSILKSQDLTAQVKMLADLDGIEKEKALVLTALNQCYSYGFIERPEIGISTPDVSSGKG